ncbi:hypothetical protein QC761_504480 [Podospora bellae-mahoneyi]|uniref:Uncharacterized protein n=1 Tax=Podospora bellae-mahoneyi TaxID=2093777 RepID=A0ABR0FDW5_9PEZI|nr:hypothetical protein QC761_504480 [Podospora bellae-mahoneyi]
MFRWYEKSEFATLTSPTYLKGNLPCRQLWRKPQEYLTTFSRALQACTPVVWRRECPGRQGELQPGPRTWPYCLVGFF